MGLDFAWKRDTVMATNWQIGDRIQNRWEVYQILKGGMGVVYIVYDHRFHEPLAAKTFQDEIFADTPAVAFRFQQEAHIWINLDSHQNIVHAGLVQNIAGKPYIFLEYISGGDLAGWIGTPRLTGNVLQVLRFAIQFCNGMGYALANGIKVHRDIKPSNCLVTQDGILKITDFGLAKTLDEVPDLNTAITTQSSNIALTRTGFGAGTCSHMSPEQFDDAKHVDVRADVYSFGVMLYQMAAGRLPFVASTYGEFERLHKYESAPALNGDSSILHRIVEQCLAKSAKDRFGDFDSLRNELANIYERLSGEQAPQPLVGPKLTQDRLINKGWSMWQLGQPDAALALFDSALDLNPDDERVWTNKGAILSVLGRMEESLECHDHSLSLNASLADAWSNKGVTLENIGRQQEALECYVKALQLNPSFGQGWFNLGMALAKANHPENALSCYSRAIELNPHDAKLFSSKGTAFMMLGRHEDARACYQTAVELNPNNERAFTDLGTALRQLDRKTEALAYHDRALELKPDYAEAWSNKGAVLADLGRLEDALSCFSRSVELSPLDAEIWFNKGSTLHQIGQAQQALDCYNRALDLAPNLAVAWYCKARLLYGGFQRYDEAVSCLEQARRLGYSGAVEVIAQLEALVSLRKT
ncbi:MAG TPA: serine/threonine-protein kinase [Pyrinomonadaceae bacterium]|nr:serine/threonine-protein kinase [Pyrinomonadaceae bacterium]